MSSLESAPQKESVGKSEKSTTEIYPDFNPEAAKMLREQAKAGAQNEPPVEVKILDQAGFVGRHREIADSSLEKARRKGEKFLGRNSERRTAAYLSRLQEIVDRHGSDGEKRLWHAAAKKLIIDEKDIPDSYWKLQEQALRDNGQNWGLSDLQKSLQAKDIQDKQAYSLESWISQLSDDDSPYPLWFKVYAWDGMSKMSIFNMEKGRYDKRDKGTVVPYPNCNPAALAKTYEQIASHYGLIDKKRGGDEKISDDELAELIEDNDFNKLYCKNLLNSKLILKTPEKTSDIHGKWVEYLPGQEKELAAAAEGTDWCITSPAVGRSYFGYGEFGHNDRRRYPKNTSKAKFLLFRLQDPVSGRISDSACASVRLGIDGNVAEISGLGARQTLEDSLVPIVKEKTLTLPGGEKYLEAFADRNKLVDLDKRMQAERLDFTEDEIDFIFELNRKIKLLHSGEDCRVRWLQQYCVDHLADLQDENAIKDIDVFVKQLLDHGQCKMVANNLLKFIDAGAKMDPTQFARQLMEGQQDYLAYNLTQFIEAGAEITPVDFVNQLMKDHKEWVLINSCDEILKALKGAGVEDDKNNHNSRPNDGAPNNDKKSGKIDLWEDKNVLSPLLMALDEPDKFYDYLMEADHTYIVANNLKDFMAVGVKLNPSKLAKWLIKDEKSMVVSNNLSQFMEAGARINPTRYANRLIKKGHLTQVAENLSQFVHEGAKIDVIDLARRLAAKNRKDVVTKNLDQFVEAGADRAELEGILG